MNVCYTMKYADHARNERPNSLKKVSDKQDPNGPRIIVCKNLQDVKRNNTDEHHWEDQESVGRGELFDVMRPIEPRWTDELILRARTQRETLPNHQHREAYHYGHDDVDPANSRLNESRPE